MMDVLQNDRDVMRWLIRQRWIAVVGQSVAIVVAVAGFGMSFDFPPLAAGLVLLALSNHLVVPDIAHPRSIGRRIGQVLALDVGLLTWMLHWTGGAANPFILFYLLHVVLAAMLLNARALVAIVLLAAGGYIWVAGFSPLFRETSPWIIDGRLAAGLAMWSAGVAMALVAGILALLVYSMRRAQLVGEEELRASSRRLAELERFKSLATLAAGVVHELGTPLGTIAVAAGELEFHLEKQPPGSPGMTPEIADDARLIRSEVERCRAILNRLDRRATDSSGHLKCRVALRDLPSMLKARLPDAQAARLSVRDGKIPAAHVLLPIEAVLQSLVVFIENACEADASGQAVGFSIDAIGTELWMRVIDRGPGIQERVRRRLGEPYFSTKQGSGTGLGLFLVRTLTAELGGDVSLDPVADGGTCATLKLPLEICP